MSDINDFVIENGVLKEYKCAGGDVVIPDCVTSIGERAFSGCWRITSIDIPDSVTSIGDGAFFGCDSLKSIVIPNGVTSIGDNAFNGCRSLTSVTIPDSATSIGDHAFYGCSSLTSIVIPDGVTSIGDGAFTGCSNLTSVTIPNGVTSIGDWTFSDCSSLKSIVIPESVTSISEYAFSECRGLADSEGFVIIRSVLYGYCGEAENIVIPDGVTGIGARAFDGCGSLKSVVIPQSVTELEENTFFMCGKMEFLWVKTNAPKQASSYLSENTKLLLALGEEDAIRFYAAASKTRNYKTGVIPSSLVFITDGSWNRYDLELINNGPEFSYRPVARFLAAVDRLRYPVELTAEAKEAYIDLLTANVKKIIPWAEYFNCPWIIKLLIDEGVINDTNRKAVNKLLKASANPDIAAFAESK